MELQCVWKIFLYRNNGKDDNNHKNDDNNFGLKCLYFKIFLGLTYNNNSFQQLKNKVLNNKDGHIFFM